MWKKTAVLLSLFWSLFAANMDKTKESYDLTASEYAKNVQALLPTKEFDEFIRLLPSSSKILDIGCGPGRDAKAFLDRGLSVTGIDFSSAMIEIAKTAAPLAEFHVMDISSLTFPESSFDGVWANASLLHIPKKELPSVLRRIHSLLKPEGVFYLSVKKGDGEILSEDLRYGGVEKFWSYFEEEELQELVTQAGFNICELAIKEKTKDYQTHPFITLFTRRS